MNLKTEMKADMVKRLAIQLMQQNTNLTMEEALSMIFNSDTYQKIMDEHTQLYYQSPRYVFAFLNEELRTGKLE